MKPYSSAFRGKPAGLLLAAICALPLLAFVFTPVEHVSDPPDPELVARGAYLVEVLACNDCHTPWTVGPNGPAPDLSRMLSGHPEGMVMPPPPKMEGPWLWAGAATNTAYAGPWGISYAANLTPDDETGLGGWTEEMFVGAIRTGQHMGVVGSRPIMPPMPWPAYAQLTDEDLKSVYAYLRSIPPIRNLVPSWEPPTAPKP